MRSPAACATDLNQPSTSAPTTHPPPSTRTACRAPTPRAAAACILPRSIPTPPHTCSRNSIWPLLSPRPAWRPFVLGTRLIHFVSHVLSARRSVYLPPNAWGGPCAKAQGARDCTPLHVFHWPVRGMPRESGAAVAAAAALAGGASVRYVPPAQRLGRRFNAPKGRAICLYFCIAFCCCAGAPLLRSPAALRVGATRRGTLCVPPTWRANCAPRAARPACRRAARRPALPPPVCARPIFSARAVSFTTDVLLTRAMRGPHSPAECLLSTRLQLNTP